MEPRDVYEKRDEVQIVDVREPEEREAGRIEGAVHVPMADVPSRLEEIATERKVVTVCRSGNRSGKAAKFLRRQGYDAENMEGGMQHWEEEELPFSTPDGRPGRVA